MSYLQIKKINLETFFLLILIFTTAGLGAAWEINVGSASLNIETLLLLALGVYLIVKKSFFLDTFKNSNVIIIFSVIFLLLFLIVDFLIRKNNGAFYELSFLVLLSSYPLSIYLHSRSKLAAYNPIWIIFILISLYLQSPINLSILLIMPVCIIAIIFLINREMEIVFIINIFSY